MGYDLSLDAKDIKALYRRFILAGWTQEEAGNMVAAMMGLTPNNTKSWTVKELQHLDFLRVTCEDG